MQGVPSTVVPTVRAEAVPDQVPHPLAAARASGGGNTGHGVPIALGEVHSLFYLQSQFFIVLPAG